MPSFQHRAHRQGIWQRSRKGLTWAEKIRIAEAIRESIAQIRRSGAANGKDSSAGGTNRKR